MNGICLYLIAFDLTGSWLVVFGYLWLYLIEIGCISFYLVDLTAVLVQRAPYGQLHNSRKCPEPRTKGFGVCKYIMCTKWYQCWLFMCRSYRCGTLSFQEKASEMPRAILLRKFWQFWTSEFIEGPWWWYFYKEPCTVHTSGKMLCQLSCNHCKSQS